MITISVNGPRGEGSTITAMRVTTWLRALGFEAEYRGHTAIQTAVIEELLRDDRTVFDRATEPRQFLVLDTGGAVNEPAKPKLHDSPTVLLATLFSAQRSGDRVLAHLMQRRLSEIGIVVQLPRKRT